MSFTTTIKQEITSIESTKSEMIAELSGFIRNNSDVRNGSLKTTSEKLNVLERFQFFIKELYQVDSEIIIIDPNKQKYEYIDTIDNIFIDNYFPERQNIIPIHPTL